MLERRFVTIIGIQARLTKGDMSKIGSSTIKFEIEKFNDKEDFNLSKYGEGVDDATRSSQDLIGQVSKTCRYVKGGFGEDGSKGSMHDSTMSHK